MTDSEFIQNQHPVSVKLSNYREYATGLVQHITSSPNSSLCPSQPSSTNHSS